MPIIRRGITSLFLRDEYLERLCDTKEGIAADKPTGVVVGQQPFGGARASGTNDKAGSMYNLLRWITVRTIKENLVPSTDYCYPYMSE